VFNELSTYALTAVTRRDHDHGQVPVGQTIRDASQEPNDTAFDERDFGELRGRNQGREVIEAIEPVSPAIRNQKVVGEGQLCGADATYFHGV
jgi:hypothetical protein